jgi:hypothetical protein
MTPQAKFSKHARKVHHDMSNRLKMEMKVWEDEQFGVSIYMDTEDIEDLEEQGDYTQNNVDLYIHGKVNYLVDEREYNDETMCRVFDACNNPCFDEDFLTNHTNYMLWLELLPNTVWGVTLAKCCAYIEYTINVGGVENDTSVWWKILRAMHYNAQEIGVYCLTDDEAEYFGLDDYFNIYENFVQDPNNSGLLYDQCVNIYHHIYYSV